MKISNCMDINIKKIISIFILLLIAISSFADYLSEAEYYQKRPLVIGERQNIINVRQKDMNERQNII